MRLRSPDGVTVPLLLVGPLTAGAESSEVKRWVCVTLQTLQETCSLSCRRGLSRGGSDRSARRPARVRLQLQPAADVSTFTQVLFLCFWYFPQDFCIITLWRETLILFAPQSFSDSWRKTYKYNFFLKMTPESKLLKTDLCQLLTAAHNERPPRTGVYLTDCVSILMFYAHFQFAHKSNETFFIPQVEEKSKI